MAFATSLLTNNPEKEKSNKNKRQRELRYLCFGAEEYSLRFSSRYKTRIRKTLYTYNTTEFHNVDWQ